MPFPSHSPYRVEFAFMDGAKLQVVISGDALRELEQVVEGNWVFETTSGTRYTLNPDRVLYTAAVPVPQFSRDPDLSFPHDFELK